MKRTAICSGVFLIFMMFLGSFSVHAQSSNPQQTLNQYISDLQKNPNDYALREKIIRHVQTMKPAPAVPEEARRYLGSRHGGHSRVAKEQEDFRMRPTSLRKLSISAPWLADAYQNLAIAQDKAGQYDAKRLRNLSLYLLDFPFAR